MTYSCAYNDGDGGDNTLYYYTKSRNLYFGGRLIRSADVAVVTDRLGSVRANANPGVPGGERFSYYPYGEERVPSADGREKFGTYFRDVGNGSTTDGYPGAVDYADQRYYAVGAGRFFTPDPYIASGGPTEPGSWNRYAYVQGDPVNLFDPSGTNLADPGYCDVSEMYCGTSIFDPSFGPINIGGGGGGGLPIGSQGAMLDGLGQYFQSLGYSVLPGVIALPAGGIGITICAGSGLCEVIAVAAAGAAAGVAVWAGVRWIFSSTADWKAGSFPTVEELQKNCTPAGPPVVVPSTRRGNRDGGQSTEQEYICPDGSSYTVHTVTDKNGNVIDQHPRYGGPKYGPRPPQHLK